MKKPKRIILPTILLLLIICGAVWFILRSQTTVPTYPNLCLSGETDTDSENVIRAVSLSYFVYGCEGCDTLAGTVSDMLNRHDMGILTENFGIVRTDPENPDTALFDTSEFIRRAVGDFRYLCSSKEKNGFFGAAFCDDEHRRIWITYSGAVTLPDVAACAGLVLAPGFTSQEKAAFRLFEAVLQSDEAANLGYEIYLTGHSLGGALATMVSLSGGCPAITVNGADGVALDKMTQLWNGQMPDCRVHNYVTHPAKGLSFMDMVQRLMFLGGRDGVTTHLFEENGYTTDTHCAFSFIRFQDEDFTKPYIPENEIEKR